MRYFILALLLVGCGQVGYVINPPTTVTCQDNSDPSSTTSPVIVESPVVVVKICPGIHTSYPAELESCIQNKSICVLKMEKNCDPR